MKIKTQRDLIWYKSNENKNRTIICDSKIYELQAKNVIRHSNL